MRKAFSLFTPLVGTAMITLAIALTVTMMQNDARIAAGLTRSYEISGQELTAKLIVAMAESNMMKNFDTITNNKLTGSNDYDSGQCNDIPSEQCKRLIKEKIESNINDSIRLNVIYELSQTFQNTMSDVTPNEAGMKSYIETHPDSIGVNIDEKIIGAINIGNDGKSVFYVTFNDHSNEMKVSIMPHGFTYTYAYPVGDYIDMTVDLLDAVSASDAAAADYETTLTTAVNSKANKICGNTPRMLSQAGFTTSKTADGTSSIDISWIINDGSTMELKVSKSGTPSAEATKTCTCAGTGIDCHSP